MSSATSTRALRGLYAITADDADSGRMLARVEAVLPYTACLQYRNKTASADLRAEQASALAALCGSTGVPLVINDDAHLARELGCGVHLGHDDGDVAGARAILGERAIIGASCYASVARARAAVDAGATYVAFGAFFPSSTKPLAPLADVSVLRESIPLGVPRVAIGGITPANAPLLIESGAELLAVISAVFDAPDPRAAARQFHSLFKDSPQ